jgi:hypothetical protein
MLDLGSGSEAAAARCCAAFEEQCQSVRAATRSGARIPLAERRRRFQGRRAAAMGELAAA